jgi:hypothetical protein
MLQGTDKSTNIRQIAAARAVVPRALASRTDPPRARPRSARIRVAEEGVVAERHFRAERDQLAAASEDEPVDLHQRGVALVEGAPQGGEEAGRRCDRLPGESELEYPAASLRKAARPSSASTSSRWI